MGLFDSIKRTAKNIAGVKMTQNWSDLLIKKEFGLDFSNLPPKTKAILNDLIRQTYIDISDEGREELTVNEAAFLKLSGFYIDLGLDKNDKLLKPISNAIKSLYESGYIRKDISDIVWKQTGLKEINQTEKASTRNQGMEKTDAVPKAEWPKKPSATPLTDSIQPLSAKENLKAGAATPQNITLHGLSRVLEITFSDGATFRIPFELMRVYSQSAEVQGHGHGQEVLQTGKRDITVEGLEPIGNNAVQASFSDGHNTGIFSWDYLYFLGSQQDKLWADYNERLAAAGVDRDAPMLTNGGHTSGSH